MTIEVGDPVQAWRNACDRITIERNVALAENERLRAALEKIIQQERGEWAVSPGQIARAALATETNSAAPADA